MLYEKEELVRNTQLATPEDLDMIINTTAGKVLRRTVEGLDRESQVESAMQSIAVAEME